MCSYILKLAKTRGEFIMQGCHSGLMGVGPISLSEGLNKLESEHLPLRNSLESLFSICTLVEEQQGVPFAELIQEVEDFSTNLEHHSVREEDILFQMMEVYLGKSGGPIAIMEYEHELAKGFISEFLTNAENHRQLTIDEMIKNALLIKNAYHTLLNHFAKEEQVLSQWQNECFHKKRKIS